MPLQSNGAISVRDIGIEFSDSIPHSMGEFYRGGTRVPNISATSTIPLSGPISLSNFYGTRNLFEYSETVTVNTPNYSVYSKLIAAGWNGTTPFVANITVPAGIWIYGDADPQDPNFVLPAFRISDSFLRIFPANCVINLILNGFVSGIGGRGGSGWNLNHLGNGSFDGNYSNPGVGSHGMNLNSAGPNANGVTQIIGGIGQNGPQLIVTGTGTIAGGGGGGGGGGSGASFGDYGDGLGSRFNVTSGGGGGAGAGATLAQTGGPPGTVTSATPTRLASGVAGRPTGNGSVSTFSTTPGSGGAGNTFNWTQPAGSIQAGGAGGRGGTMGAAGLTGSNGYNFSSQYPALSDTAIGIPGGVGGSAIRSAQSIPNLSIAPTINIFGSIVQTA